MKKSKCRKPADAAGYELAASVRGETVGIYGRSLEEVCLRHKGAIKKTVSYDLRAIEQGQYAIFMLSQLDNFPPHRQAAVSRRITVLLEDAIETLHSLENRERSKYRHIIRRFREYLGGPSMP